ncbi:MAG: hypothetical protein QM749_11325 [Aquabacterium sp.]
MAKITITDYVLSEHPNHMGWIDNEQKVRHEKSDGLAPYKVCLVEVCGFQFIFHSIMQIELCIDYYSRTVQPTSRLPVHTQNLGGDHWETQRWFEKLPMFLLEKAKRPKVIAALEKARTKYSEIPGARTSTPKPAIWVHKPT